MDKIKVCFVGVGSIAKRHIKNLQELFHTQITIDAFRSQKSNIPDKVISNTIHNSYDNLSEMPADYDVIFITNPTRYHYETLVRFSDKGRHFFIEKPVFDSSDIDITALGLKKDSVYYVACPLRYKKVLQYVKECVDLSQVLSARCISSSYLPEWRTGIDYRQTYSARKELGGGVAIDLIHEWDYIQHLFGLPQMVYSMTGQVSDLEITSDDIAVYIAKYKKMFVELHLDYFGRTPIRELQIFTREDTLICDLIQNRIRFLKADKEIQFVEKRDDYQKKELSTFFDMINGRAENINSIETALKTLRLAERNSLDREEQVDG